MTVIVGESQWELQLDNPLLHKDSSVLFYSIMALKVHDLRGESGLLGFGTWVHVRSLIAAQRDAKTKDKRKDIVCRFSSYRVL